MSDRSGSREVGADPPRLASVLVAVLIAVLAGGCATVKPMALGGEGDAPALERASIVLMTVRTANQHKPGYPPDASHILIDTGVRGAREIRTFRLDEAYRSREDGVREYLVSLDLPPGSYRLREIFGSSGTFPIHGRFVVTVFLPFTVEPNTVAYLGRLEATVRERKDDREFRAGPPVPIIDQAVTGFASGTFVVRISDAADEDLAAFHERYPGLRRYAIRRTILPAWTQPAAKDLE